MEGKVKQTEILEPKTGLLLECLKCLLSFTAHRMTEWKQNRHSRLQNRDYFDCDLMKSYASRTVSNSLAFSSRMLIPISSSIA